MAAAYGSSSTLTNYADKAPAMTEMPEGSLSSEIRDLHSQLQALDDVTGQLRIKLEGLATDRPRPAPGDCQAVKPVLRSKIAGEIHAAVDLACNITAKVNDMLCCLEL